MKKLHFLYTWATAVALLFSVGCSSDDQDAIPVVNEPQPLTKSHTLIIYMLGDNNLSSDMDKNLQRILSVYSEVPELGNIAIFYDRGTYTRLTKLVIEDGMVKQKLLEDYPKGKSALGEEFTKGVMAKVREELPADSYGLILSSHGGGWVPAEIFDMYYLLGPDSSSTASAQPMFFGQDGSDYMEIPELRAGLEEMHFNYIIFDACLMASVEALYEMRNSADFIIASSAEILGTGFPYEKIIPMLFTNGHMLVRVCEEYMSYYAESSGTISLINCHELENLAVAVKDVLAAWYEKEDAGQTLRHERIQHFDGFYRHLYFDLRDYLDEISDLGHFDTALNKAVVYKDCTDNFYTGFVYSGAPVGETGDAHVIRIRSHSGLTCHIEQDDCPLTHEAWLETEWAKAVGGR